MSSFRDPDHQERLTNASAAKKAMLEKFRAASDDPAIAERQAARAAVNTARLARVAARLVALQVVLQPDFPAQVLTVAQAQDEGG